MLKKVLITMTTMFTLSDSVSARSLSDILKKPLILGASVSEGYLAESPGKILAKRYTEAANIRTVAANGANATQTMRRVSSDSFADRSAVIAVDLFFWDSIQRDPAASLQAMQRLFAEVRSRQLPLVVGDIPHLMPSYQPAASRLNQELHRLCGKYENCYVLPLDRMAKHLLATGNLEHEGKRYGLADLLPDGLHVSKVASSYLADRISDLLLGSR